MKTFKRFLIESKKINEEWKDAHLYEECEDFLTECDIHNITKRNANGIDWWDATSPEEFVSNELRWINDTYDEIFQKMVDTKKETAKAMGKICKSLLDRLNKEYKTSDEKDVVESLINLLKEKQAIIKTIK